MPATHHQELESLAVEVGKATGDLTFPLVYAPEFLQGEFRSAVADMKNSVASRDNAQSSCAGQFIGKRGDLRRRFGPTPCEPEEKGATHLCCKWGLAFTGSHLGDQWLGENKWLHIDMASPVHDGERATGYGVNLLVELLERMQ